MKRIISILALSAFVGISGLSAGVDSSESKAVQTLSKADSEFLFGSNAKNLNMQVLSKQEMEETKAMWAPFFWGVGYGFATGFAQPVVSDYRNNRPINWGGALQSGLKDAAFGAVGAGIAKHLLKIR